MKNALCRKDVNRTITSLEVAEMLGKEHKLIIRDIEGGSDRKGIIEVLAENQLEPSDYFIETTYKDTSGKTNKCYEVTKMGCEMLGNKQQGEKGILFTAKYVKRFNDMEDSLKGGVPKTYKEALVALVAEIEEKERIEAENKLLMHVSKLYTSTELAKELGFKSAIAFNKELESRKIQFKVNGTWVMSAKYSILGYVDIKQNVLDSGKVVYDRKWTQDGRKFLLSLFEIEDKAS